MQTGGADNLVIGRQPSLPPKILLGKILNSHLPMLHLLDLELENHLGMTKSAVKLYVWIRLAVGSALSAQLDLLPVLSLKALLIHLLIKTMKSLKTIKKTEMWEDMQKIWSLTFCMHSRNCSQMPRATTHTLYICCILMLLCHNTSVAMHSAEESE